MITGHTDFSAYVTVGIAGIIVKVIIGYANFSAYVTIGITSVSIFVGCYILLFTANVTFKPVVVVVGFIAFGIGVLIVVGFIQIFINTGKVS
jgi:hypothetical protein